MRPGREAPENIDIDGEIAVAGLLQ